MSGELPELRLMPDYSADLPLRGSVLSQLNLSARLLDELSEWQQDFDENFDPHTGWTSEVIKSTWATRAASLEMDLRAETIGKATLSVDLWPLE